MRAIRKAPAMAVTAGMVLFRRKDGAILMAIGDKNGPVESGYPDIPMTDMPPVVAFSFPSTLAAVDAKEGAKVRLAKHIGQDGLVVGLSVGQVVAAIKADVAAPTSRASSPELRLRQHRKPDQHGIIKFHRGRVCGTATAPARA